MIAELHGLIEIGAYETNNDCPKILLGSSVRQ